MAILHDPYTGDSEPTDPYDDPPMNMVFCPDCRTFHPCDDEQIYSTCRWALDQMNELEPEPTPEPDELVFRKD